MQATIHPVNVHDVSQNTQNSYKIFTEIYRSLQFLLANQDAFLSIKIVFAEFRSRKLTNTKGILQSKIVVTVCAFGHTNLHVQKTNDNSERTTIRFVVIFEK